MSQYATSSSTCGPCNRGRQVQAPNQLRVNQQPVKEGYYYQANQPQGYGDYTLSNVIPEGYQRSLAKTENYDYSYPYAMSQPAHSSQVNRQLEKEKVWAGIL